MADKEGLLPFKLIEDESGEALTSFGGLPLVVERPVKLWGWLI